MYLWGTRLWKIIGAVNIRIKIMGIVLGLVILMGVTVTLQVRANLIRTLDQLLEEQSVSIGRDVAARSTDLILINNLYGLHQLLEDTRTNNPNVRYAFIVDPQNHILVHTFGDGFPAGLLEANATDSGDHHRTAILHTDEGQIWDTAVSIFEGRAGTARIGVSDASLRVMLDALTGQIMLTTVLVSIIGITAAAALTWLLTRPILQLVGAAQAVERGDFRQRIIRWANDEIGELTDAFNAMIAALARAQDERAERDLLRIEYVKGVISAQEDERRRIARELHDSTSQTLTSLVIGLRQLSEIDNPAETRQRAEELRAIAAQTLDDVHGLALQLRPSVLDDLGLPAAIQRHVADCRRRHQLDIDLAITGFDDERLSPEVETALYRITQEALTNILRHAHAQTASIFIERSNGTVRAVIEDDGIGFDLTQSEPLDGHLGLYGIRERAELLGGKLTIESERARGTSLYIEIPIDGGSQ
ncbi:MAG: HAMP domain-containing protein [Anaerolinea sp.]|nr:HAMP domain-containing protein [Anaerolinea sp.]